MLEENQNANQNPDVPAIPKLPTIPWGLRKTKGKLRKFRPKGKPFAAVELQAVECQEWRTLSFVARHVYIMLKLFYKGERKSFKAPFSSLKARSGIKHGNTINKALKELEEKGWVQITRFAKHGKRRGLRVKANEYTLTFKYDYGRW